MTGKKGNTSMMCMHFSGVYRDQDFYEKKHMLSLSLEGMPGTNCYCDDLAVQEIKKRIEELPLTGIHFLDSGNYHYMSRIWMEKIQTPYRLVVLDHHTDLQPPAFGGILSCGGWIASSLEELPNLREVVLIGPEEKDFSLVMGEWKGRIRYLSQEALEKQSEEETMHWLKSLHWDLPLYLSVDKDVLSEEEVKTNWSQGKMRLKEMMVMLEGIAFLAKEHSCRILGMDVCGEGDSGYPETSQRSNRINLCLAEYWEAYTGCEGGGRYV